MAGHKKEKREKVHHVKNNHSSRKSKSSSNTCNLVLSYLISFARCTYDFIVSIVFYYIYKNTPSKILPPVEDQLVLESCVAIINKIKNKEITCRRVIECFIRRIEQVNPILNAVVDTRFDKALAEADEYDKLIELADNEEKINLIFDSKPLFGIPFTSKESTGAKGMAWTFGMVSRTGIRSNEDAEIVKSLKTAGAILIGITNVPELNLWYETRNKIYGKTNNPYNTNYSAGGSSGGEASIISACGSPLGLGTDIGGSARIPAFNCGIFGHKLTTGYINTKGMTFRKGTEKHTIVSAGPLTRYADDLIPVIKALLGPEKSLELKIDQDVDLSSLKYYYVDKPDDVRVSPISNELQIALLQVLQSITSITELPPLKVKLSGMRHSFKLWKHWMTKEEGLPFDVSLGNNQERVSVWLEVPKLIVGRSNHTLAAVLKLIDMKLPKVNATWADAETKTLSNEITTLLGDDGILFFPSSPTTTKHHYEPFLYPYNFAYWAIFNVLKLPVIQVPLGLSKNGLPLGIQVVAGMNQDRLCIAVAKHIEKTFGGWKPPFIMNTS